jgi:hypothetical protein
MLKDLVRHGSRALQWPHVARAVVLAGEFFPDPHVARIVRAIMVCGGDWRAALADLLAESRQRVPPAGAVPLARLEAFEAWANKVAHEPARQLTCAS